MCLYKDSFEKKTQRPLCVSCNDRLRYFYFWLPAYRELYFDQVHIKKSSPHTFSLAPDSHVFIVLWFVFFLNYNCINIINSYTFRRSRHEVNEFCCKNNLFCHLFNVAVIFQYSLTKRLLPSHILLSINESLHLFSIYRYN